MDGAAGLAASGPGGKFAPVVGAGVEGVDWSDLVLGSFVLEIFREERSESVLAEVSASVAAEFTGAKGIGVLNFLAVMPRAQHEKDFVIVGVFRLESFVDGD